MPRTTNRGSRVNVRRAAVVGLTSLATLTLVPLLAQARPSERALLLLAAVPAAALFGCLAGYAGGTSTHLEATTEDLQQRAAQLRAAQRSAAVTLTPSGPVVTPVGEPVPRAGTGSPVGTGHLAGLARPPADRQPGPRAVPAVNREVFTAEAPTPGGPEGTDPSGPHLTLIVTRPAPHPTR